MCPAASAHPNPTVQSVLEYPNVSLFAAIQGGDGAGGQLLLQHRHAQLLRRAGAGRTNLPGLRSVPLPYTPTHNYTKHVNSRDKETIHIDTYKEDGPNIYRLTG